MSDVIDKNTAEMLVEACGSIEKAQQLIQQYLSKKTIVHSKLIQVTYTCKLCGYVDIRKETVEVTSGVESHSHSLDSCRFCAPTLAKLEKKVLVKLLLNAVRYGQPHPEHIKASEGGYEYQPFSKPKREQLERS